MQRFLGLLLCLGLLSVGTTGLASERASLPTLADIRESQANLTIESPVLELTQIRMAEPQVRISELMVDFENYQSFEIIGENMLWAQGRPAVPRVTRLYRIPNTGTPHLELGEMTFDLLESIDALPLQMEEGSFQLVDQDEALYGTDAWYPPVVAEMSEPMVMRDFRVVEVTFYPVQINPVTRQARVYNRLDADVVTTPEPGLNEITVSGRPSGAFAPMYRGLVANLDESALDDATETPGSYMILCKTDTISRRWADSLATWKTRRGYKVIVDARATWNYTQARTAIRAAYNQSLTTDWPLEFACLVGDPDAPFGVPTSTTGYDGEYDHYYACMNDDIIGDIGVGRLSGISNQEMAVINAKTLGYERNPHMADTTWYRRAFCYAGIGNEIASNYTLMQWAAQQFRTFTGVTNPNVQTHSGAVNEATVISQFNSGISFFFWRGTWLGQMSTGLANQTNNGWRLPVVFCVTCGANEYVGGTGIAESYLVAGSTTNPKGGVCSIGTTTSGTHAPQNITFSGGLIFAIINQHIEHVGPAMMAGKVWLGYSYGFTNDYTLHFSRWNNLMGDPGLSMWTDVPTVIEAAHPSALNIGSRQVSLTVRRPADNIPVADAVVCLWKRGADSTWVRGVTDAEGQVTLPVNVNAAGDLYVTVTKRNHKPYLATIPCSQGDVMPMFSTCLLDDDNAGGTQGNNDLAMNPGEVIDLSMYVRNFGSGTPATGITTTLTSNNPRVTVVQGAATYPNLAPGDSALGSTPFRISVAPTMQHYDPVLLTLTVNSAAGTVTGSLQLRAVAGHVEYVSQSLSGPLDPGQTRNLTVTLRNGGAMPMNNVTAQLQSLSPFVQVSDAAGTFGTIAVGAQGSNTADLFTVVSNPLAFRGHQAPMLLITTTSDGQVDSAQFILSVGQAQASDPTGPDAFGYYAYDNSDATYEMHPTYEWLDISAGLGTNLNLNDPGEKNSITQVTSTARRLPFAFKFYGQVFDTITVCSNGWCAFGNQAWNDNFRNFRIPAMQAPQNMIAPFWDDLNTQGTGRGVWTYYDSTNHRFVIQWKAVQVQASNPLNFEVMLYDTTYHVTFDGNGKVLIQYNQVSMAAGDIPAETPGMGVGIQNANGLIGLGYYNNHGGYAAGAATIVPTRAIMFTTDARMMFGDVDGTVLDAATNQPVAGVTVSIDGYGYNATTNVAGQYLIQNVLIGDYSVRAHLRRYNDAVVEGVVVVLDSVTTVNLSMLHPGMALSTDTVRYTIGAEPADTTFNILNDGNGPLDYAIEIFYAGDESPEPWDSVGSVMVSDLVQDRQIMGCEFAGEFWYITGGGGANGQNLVYKFDLNGAPQGSLPQPATTPIGWFDLASDGEFLYGSDGPDIIGIDTLTGAVEATIPSPVNPARAIAYDPQQDHFWIADYTSDIFEIDRNGNVIQQVANEGAGELSITGLAWYSLDAEGFKLYVFSQNGPRLTRVSRLHPTSHTVQTVVDLPGNTGDRAGGCTITGGWNSTLLVFGGVMQNAGGDRLEVFEMAFNTTWIEVAPAAFTVPGGGSREVEVRFDPVTLRNGSYNVNLHISSVVYDTTMILPVILVVDRVSAVNPDPGTLLPTEFALYQNYPNPFNPSTHIRFDLPTAAPVRLEVYNALGQQVAILADEVRPAGTYTVAWNGRSSQGLDAASGVYFFRLQAGDFVSVKKMLLMR